MVLVGAHASTLQREMLSTWRMPPSSVFLAKNQFVYPYKYLFSLSKKMFSGSKYPKNSLSNSEKGSTDANKMITICTISRQHNGDDFVASLGVIDGEI